jgi:hypothetical protein
MFDDGHDNSPQFETAQYASGPEQCKACGQAIAGSYYRLAGAVICPSCAQRAQQKLPGDSHSAYVRALIFGIVAAVLGMIGYAAFGILTGLVIGYLSLGVGYIVGKAMMMGSSGIGGRRYQITAALLTYAAVSIAAVPMGIAQFSKEKHAVRQEQASPEAESAGQQTSAAPRQPPRGLGSALGSLALLGLASPFLELQDPVHGAIGFIILLVGIRIAWQSTAGRPRAALSGPF